MMLEIYTLWKFTNLVIGNACNWYFTHNLFSSHAEQVIIHTDDWILKIKAQNDAHASVTLEYTCQIDSIKRKTLDYEAGLHGNEPVMRYIINAFDYLCEQPSLIRDFDRSNPNSTL